MQTTTQNGVTCTNNGDGKYTLNGTASSQVVLNITQNVENKFIGNKLLGCPSGGSSETYSLLISYFAEDNSWLNENYDVGNGIIIGNSSKINVSILIRSGTVCNNLIFKPMLTTNLSATYDDFVPYTGDGETLTHDVAELKNDLGGLKFSLKHYDNVEIDSTHNVAFVDKSLLPVDITRIKSVFVDGDNCISARRNSESNIIVTKTGDVTSLSFDLLFLYE